MDPVLSSTLLLTTLMGIGLGFFLRAASKDRTTTVDVNSSRPPVEVLDGLNHWLLARGWQASGGDPERQVMRFEGAVASSRRPYCSAPRRRWRRQPGARCVSCCHNSDSGRCS